MPDDTSPRLIAEQVRGLAADPLTVVAGLVGLAGDRRLSVLDGRWGTGGTIVLADPVQVHEPGPADQGDPFAHLDHVPALAPSAGEPGAVGGGWVTVLGHALGSRTGRVRVPPAPGATVGPPRLVGARYDHVLRHDGSSWWAEALDTGDGAALDRARGLADLARSAVAPTAGAGRAARLTGVPDADLHMVAVERCVDAIRAGDIAQANVCARFALELADGGPAAVLAWTQLVRALRPDRAVLVTGPWGALVGASPELYLSIHDGVVVSAPIKGTRPAGEQAALRASAKDTAENVMIVDLVRNDLSRVCDPGSVRVSELLAVRAHAGVCHLVSEVTGRLGTSTSTSDVVRATFPPGSVTGTPKQRATEVTNGLEPAPRGAHTGAAGLVCPGFAELAVSIRTLEVAADGRAELGVGGGIVADSTAVEEWSEVLTKAAPLLRALGVAPPAPSPQHSSSKGLADTTTGLVDTFLVVHGRVVERAGHLARLQRSTWETSGSAPASTPEEALDEQVTRLTGGVHRVRLLVRPDGSVTTHARPWRLPLPARSQAGLVLAVTEGPPQGLERHKYADRRWLEAYEAACPPGADAVVLAAPGDAGLWETTRACLFAVLRDADGPVLLTPAADGRILPGVTRQVVVDLALADGTAVRRGRLDADVLSGADAVFTCNALRGVQWVRSLGPFAWPGPGPVVERLSTLLLQRWGLPD